MKKLKVTCFSICTVIITLFASTAGLAQKGDSGNVKTSLEPMRVFGQTTIIPYGGSSVSRNNEGAFWNISTSGLTPGNVTTLWVVIFNNPENCSANPCLVPDLNNPLVNASLQFGGGAITSAGGRVDFSGYLGLGDNTGYYRLPQFPNMPDPAPGLVNSKGAEIHLVMRDHGPALADPILLQEQLSTFGGGCGINVCANAQYSPHL